MLLLGLCLISCGSLLAIDCPVGDFNGDCIIDIQDLLIVADKWLNPGWICPEPGIAGIWKMDETAGNDVPDITAVYPGQTVGNPLWRPTGGKQGGALELDGVDDYVTIPGYTGISGSSPRTCAAWIQTTATPTPILSWGDKTAVGGIWEMRINTLGQLRVQVNGGGTNSASAVNTGQWVHVAAVLPAGKSNTRDIQLYVNGALETVTTTGAAINTSNLSNVRIGANDVEHFKGLLDDVRIYNRALTASEIGLVYSTGSTVEHCVDINGDGAVNIADLAPISTNWLKSYGPVVISEFLADNDSKAPLTDGEILDGNGESSDWIELYNPSGATVNLEGWSLTDTAAAPRLWSFPAGATIGSGQYLIVFASKKEQSSYPTNYPYKDSKGYWHTNFKLDTAGEYLALTTPAGRTATEFKSYEFSPGQFGYPPQKKNISYGLYQADVERYFAVLTPGKANAGDVLGIVGNTQSSVPRGFYTSAFLVTIATDTPGSTIRYTLNGTDPTLNNGITYTQPIRIDRTTCLRTAAFKAGWKAGKIDTHTYIFPNSHTPWQAAITTLPVLSLVGDAARVFYYDTTPGVIPTPATSGVMAIYGGSYSDVWVSSGPTSFNNPTQRGIAFERPVSAELISPTDNSGFHEDCGIRVHGSEYMRPRYWMQPAGYWGYPNKFSFRLYFRSQYGDPKLDYPLFPKFETDSFDNIVLRGGHNDISNPFVRDELQRRLHKDMGQVACSGSFANLLINGEYKGYYNITEHVSESFCQHWFDSKEAWDVMTMSGIREGDSIGWDNMIAFAQNHNLSDSGNYLEMLKRIDVVNFVDYLIIQAYGGNWDWPQNNWSAAAERSEHGQWRFFIWDAEGSMDGDVGRNRFGDLNSQGGYLSILHRALKAHPDYRQLWSDRLQKHFLETGGALTKANLLERFNELKSEVIGVIPNMETSLPNIWFPQREEIFFGQCKSESLFTFAAPILSVNGAVRSGGNAWPGDSLSMANAPTVTGTIYYTLDGTDPRQSSDSLSISNLTLVPESATKKILVPTSNIGTTWRGGTEPYSDSGWTAGVSVPGKSGGLGYEKQSGYESMISRDLSNEMYYLYNNNNPDRISAYVRIPFTLTADQKNRLNSLTLRARYDDGFVAYLNGGEVARSPSIVSQDGNPTWNTCLWNQAYLYESTDWESFDLSEHLSQLKTGTNILAFHALNTSIQSSDFLLTTELLAIQNTATPGNVSPAAVPYTAPVVLTKSCQVKARTYNATTQTWSALQDSTFSVGPVKENLVISEVMYHPDGDPNSEFLELYNSGSETLDLSRVRFEKGIDFTFGLTPATTTIGPSGYLVLARNPGVFTARYGAVAGQYGGALDSNGERIRLVDAIGAPIADFTYSNRWFDMTDGGGFSLTLRNPRWDSTIPTTGLVSLWRLDETTGAAVWDSQGVHPGVTGGDPAWRPTGGKEGGALEFDGVNDTVTIGGYPGILGSQPRTCTAWIKTTASTVPILFWGDRNTPGGMWEMRINSSGQLRVQVFGAGTNGASAVNTGQWVHVAAVLPAGLSNTQDIQLFVNGRREAVTAAAATINTSALSPVRIGSTDIYYYKGLLDEVRIYDRALTETEIALMLQQRPSLEDKSSWRPSARKGGSPGTGDGGMVPELGSVVINEVLSHSHGTDPDWIELGNTTDQPIPIGGWFLSNNNASEPNRMSYEIPAGTVIPRNGFVVFYENLHFGNPQALGCHRAFGLSEGGDTVYLQSGSGGQLTGYYADESFGAAESGVSFGRYAKSTLDGGYNFVAMSSLTPNGANADPKVGPIVITEIHYNPGTQAYDWDKEYIELKNISGVPVTLEWYDEVNHVTVPWKFTDGIQFTFPLNTTIDPGKRILVVKNEAALRAAFPTIPGDTQVFQWTLGSLNNAGEKIELSRPGDQEPGKDRYYIRMERVNYNNASPWPAADGTGKSLTRIADDLYGNDAANWQAATPSPGQ